MSRQARRGLALLGILAVLAGSCSAIGLGGDDGYTVKAEFRRTFNLFSGSVVRVLGVDVGTVEALAVPAGSDRVTVTLRLDDSVTLPQDVAATIVPEALLGERFVQLAPAYTGGPRLEPGETIPLKRTAIPAEWDEVFHSLNDLVTQLDEDELARLVSNLAEILDGRGDDLGRVLEQANTAIGALEASDDDIVALASRLADLNETLAARDQALGEIIDDWDTVVTAIAEQRGELDTALHGLATFSRDLADLLADHQQDLRSDIATLTRIGRTAARNLDQLELSVKGQATLFELGSKAFDFERNWMPLVNHSSDLGDAVADRLAERLTGLCIRLEIDACADPSFWDDVLGGQPVCLPPVVLCPEPPSSSQPAPEAPSETLRPLGDVLDEALDTVPELRSRLEAEQQGVAP